MPQMPFQVADHDYQRPGWVWCVRCENWIPFEAFYGAVGGAVDPHPYDHLIAWQALRGIDRNNSVLLSLATSN